MLLHDWGKGLLRRWYFILLGIVLTVCGALFLTTLVPPTYQGTARIVLIPPKSSVPGGGNGNPYLFLGGLEQALGVLTVRISSGAVGEEILRGHAGGSYAVEKDAISSGPIMLITTEAESPKDSLRVLDKVLDVVPKNLESMQDELQIPAASQITAMTVVREDEPKTVLKSQLRAVLAGVAVGLSLTVLLTGLLDRLLSHPKRNARRRRASGPEEEPVGAPASATAAQEKDIRPSAPDGQPSAAEVPGGSEDQIPDPEPTNDGAPTLAANR